MRFSEDELREAWMAGIPEEQRKIKAASQDKAVSYGEVWTREQVEDQTRESAVRRMMKTFTVGREIAELLGEPTDKVLGIMAKIKREAANGAH